MAERVGKLLGRISWWLERMLTAAGDEYDRLAD